MKDDETVGLADLRRSSAFALKGSELEGRIAQFLRGGCRAGGLAFRPACYLGDEWFSPRGRARHCDFLSILHILD